MNLEEKQKELSALLDLPNNWNGYGEKEIDRATVARAHQFLLMICDMELPNIYPLSDGGVFMAWRVEDLTVSFLPEKTETSLAGELRYIPCAVTIEWSENGKDLGSIQPINDDFAYVNPIRQLIKRLDELQ